MRAVRGFRVGRGGGKRRRTRAIRLPPVVSENFPGLGEMVPGKFSERIACPCAPCGFRAPMRVQGRRQKGPQQVREAVSRARGTPAIRQRPHTRGRGHRRVDDQDGGVGRRGARRGLPLPDSAGFRGREGQSPLSEGFRAAVFTEAAAGRVAGRVPARIRFEQMLGPRLRPQAPVVESFISFMKRQRHREVQTWTTRS